MSIKGWPTQEKDARLSPQFATVEPVRTLQHSLSVLAHQFVREVGTDTVEASSTVTVINATSHAAQAGDVIRFTSGTLSGQEVKVYAVSTNEITLAEELPSAPALGVGFQILRHKYPVVETTGEIKVTGTFSTTEAAVAADGDPLPALTKVVSGYDGAAVQVLKTDSNGELQVDVLSSALPTGAATSAKQDSEISLLTTIDADTSTLSACVSSNKVQTDVNSIINTVDSSNSTTVALAGGANFTGSWVENKNYGSIQVGIKADQNSATDGVEIQFSNDGSTVHHSHVYTYYTASGGIGYLFQPEFKYYRIKFTNGAVAQTSFSLSTTPRSIALFPSQYRINTSITNETQALMTRAVITGETTSGGGAFVNVKVNPSGALTVDSTLSAIDAALAGQKTMANSLPVVIASNQSAVPASQSGTWNINNISGTISLPTGAATESTLSTLNGKVTACNTGAVTISSSALPTGAATESTLSTLNGKVTACNTGAVTISSALPSGTNTIGKVDVNTLSVIDLLDAGILDTSSTNIPGSASSPVQVVASTAAATKKLQLLDTTGAFVGIYTGGSGSEVLQFVMGPGSDQTIEHAIPASTRISLKRLDSTTAVSTGIVAINFIG